MEAEFLKYQKLFTEFNKLDKMEDTFVTFMELSGYPHFENVCSNILSFYSKRIPRGSASGSMRKSLKNGWFFITL